MKKILLILLLTIPFIGFGQVRIIINEHSHSVDIINENINKKYQKNELNGNSPVRGMLLYHLDNERIRFYDRLLNKYYNLIKDVLPDTQFIYIKNSQRSWIKLRNETENYIKSVDGNYIKNWIEKDELETSWFGLSLILDLYQHRAYEIYSILEDLEEKDINKVFLIRSYTNTYYENESIKSREGFLDYKDGCQRYYYDNGILKSEQFYDSRLGYGDDLNWILVYGKGGGLVDSYEPRVGVWKDYYENGQLILERKYEKGILIHKLKKDYYENGQLSLERKYEKGRLISSRCWNEDGYYIKCKD